MTPNDDDGFELTREEYINLIELRRDVSYIRACIKKLVNGEVTFPRCLEHMNEVAQIKGRMVVFSIVVPILTALIGILLGKLL